MKIIFLCVMCGFLNNLAITKNVTFTYPDGVKYIGQVQGDKPHGQGEATYPDGSKYVGQWKDGMYHGRGTFISDGTKTEGQFEGGRLK